MEKNDQGEKTSLLVMMVSSKEKLFMVRIFIFSETLSFTIFTLLPFIESRSWSIISHNSCPDFANSSFAIFQFYLIFVTHINLSQSEKLDNHIIYFLENNHNVLDWFLPKYMVP